MLVANRVPIVPSDSLFGGNAASLGADGLAFYERCEALGPIVRARVFAKRIWVITGPDLVEQVLVKNTRAFIKPHVLRRLKVLFGDSLLTGDGGSWLHRRRLLQPLFHARQTVRHAPILEKNVAALVMRIRKAAGSAIPIGACDVHTDIVETCIENLTESFFGVASRDLTARIKRLATTCHVITQAMGTLRFPYYVVWPSLIERRFGRRVRLESDELLACIRDLRGAAAPGDDFLQRLAQGQDPDGCPFGAHVVQDEVVTMLLAGHETAAAAVSWALQLLAQHPDVRDELARQIEDVCADAAVRVDDLPKIPLVEQVLLETYRLYPPTHRIGRTVVEPTSLGGAELAPGDDINIPQWAIHRSARSYDAPAEFRPERWTADFMARLPRCAFIPFSAGPRVCIGQSVVMVEDALLIANLVHAFDFELGGAPMEPVEGLTLLPGEGGRMPLRLEPRRHPVSSAPKMASGARA